jgi:hypothetical protein
MHAYESTEHLHGAEHTRTHTRLNGTMGSECLLKIAREELAGKNGST